MKPALWILLCAFSAGAFGQSASPASDAVKLGGATVTASLRLRFYGWDWFQPTAGQNDYLYSGNLLRVGLAGKRESWDWTAEFAAPFMLGLPDNATGTGANQGALGLGANYFSANHSNSNTAMLFPKQVFVRFDGLGGSKSHTLRIGRFEFLDGSELAPKNASLAALKRDRVSQRLLGGFGFSDVGRSFDGVQYAFSRPKDNFTFVGAVPTRGVFQTDGWGWNRIAFGYAAYTHQWGTGRHSADTRVFALEYDDWRHILKMDNRALAARKADLANIRVETFGGHSLHAIATGAGPIDLLVWGAVQSGRWGVQKHRAHAFDAEGGFQPKILVSLKPWVRGGYYRGSGDSNPSDDRHETFFQVLPTPRPYARFPFFNMMNNRDAFGILILRPHPKVAVSTEFHSLGLSDSHDFWYSGGGAFQPWTFGYTGRSTSGRNSLGNLYDASVEIRATKKMTATAYFGYTQGLGAMEQIYPKGKNGSFGYLELVYRL